jgi:osmotically-inducible protein OsmY
MNKTRLMATVAAAAASALVLACSPQDRSDAKTDASRAANATGNAAERAADATGDAARKAGNAVAETASDATLTTKVKSALLADEEVKGLQINVDTANQIVTLTGQAQSASAKQRAEQLALQVDGVKSVKNNINVAGGGTGGTGTTGTTKGTTSKGG